MKCSVSLLLSNVSLPSIRLFFTESHVDIVCSHVFLQLQYLLTTHIVPAAGVEDADEVVTVEEQVADGLHAQILAIPDLHLLQPLHLVTHKDLVKYLISDVTGGPHCQFLDVETQR